MDENSFKYLNDRLKTVETIVLGNPEFGVPSLNDRLRGIDGCLTEMSVSISGILAGKDRERWAQYAIAFFLALNVIGLIAVFFLLAQLLRQ